MNKKNKRMLIILGAVLVFACLLYIVITRVQAANEAKKASEAAAESEAARVFVSDMDEVTNLTLNTGEATLTFVKDGETWHYKEDEKFPASQDILRSIAEAMKKFEADRRLEDGDALSAYGFGEDNLSVTAADTAGNTKTIIYGNESGDGYYVKADDADTVYTAGTTLYSQFQGKTLYDFVESETLPTTFSDDITQVKLEFDGETYVYDRPDEEESEAAKESKTKESENSENETEAETKSAGEEAFEKLAAAIPGMTIAQCADYYADAAELKAYGLDKPQMTIEYVYTDSDGNTQTQIIYVGSKAEKAEDTDTEAYYIQLGGSDMVNTISVNSIDGLKGYVTA